MWPWLAALLFVVAAGVGGWYVWRQLSNPGVAKVHVEYYVNERRAQAVRQIDQIGLKPKVQKQSNDTTAAGLVFEQSPKEGDLVAKGSTVKIWVSTGKPKAQVPDVVGQTQDAAVKTLTDAGFHPEVHSVPGGTAGQVTATAPGAGKLAVKGSTVRVNVASGPAPVIVPHVTGEPIAKATSDLHSLGFDVNPTYVDDNAPANQVIEQDPAPAARRRRRSRRSTSRCRTARRPRPCPT